jgi:cysteine-rich repeat protein
LLTVPVDQGETVYVVVESPNRDVVSAFQLMAVAHEVVCGDGYVDLNEECDDGNAVSDDGCSDTCVFLSDETEPNATIQAADVYLEPVFFGEIASASDVDVVAIDVGAGQKLIAETFDLGDGACGRHELDDLIEVLDSSGSPIASDDDGGIGFCAALVTDALGAGTYYVRVRASGVAESFLYRLSVRLENQAP